MKSKLNKVELLLCFAFLTFSCLFSLYKLYESQEEILQNYNLKSITALQPGWSCLDRLKDTSDEELSLWKFVIRKSWFYLLAQFVISEIIRTKKLCHIKYWYIASSFIFVTLHFGFKQQFLFLLQPLLFAAIIFAGGKETSIWIASVSLTKSYSSVTVKHFVLCFINHENLLDEELYSLLSCIGWIDLRCISYCLDHLERQKKAPVSSKFECFVDMLSYCLYAPLLYTGPVILYEEFKKSYDTPNEKLWTRLKSFTWDMCHYLFYMLMLDVLLHYIYFYALRTDISLIEKLPIFALCGGCLWMGVHFQTIYVIIYGTATAFAKLDNIETPPTPRCIARIHAYSQMWRYFDVGLYKFLVKYVYKPIMSTISSMTKLPEILNKMLATLVTFSFIFVWHGGIKRIFIWCLLNYIEISLEYFAKAVSDTDFYRWFKKNILKTDAMETRFIGIISMSLLIISAVSNLYLFSLYIGNVYFENCFLHPSFSLNAVLVSLALYCCCIVSMTLRDFPSRTAGRKLAVKAVE